MSLVTWSNDYGVKVRQFDEQHRKLFDIVNELYDAMRDGKGTQVVNKVLDSLVSYTQAHFSAEERLMRLYEFPGYSSHKKLHDQLVSQVRDFQGRAEKDPGAVTLAVMTFLKNWLVQHIQGEDANYGPFLNGKGID